MKKEEATVHMKVFQWIKENEENYPVLMTVFHCPSSFFGSNFGVIVWLKKLGFRRGIYDLIIPISKKDHSAYWIEFKAEKKRLSKDQKEIMERINKYSDRSTKFEVFYDSDLCIESIKNYLDIV